MPKRFFTRIFACLFASLLLSAHSDLANAPVRAVRAADNDLVASLESLAPSVSVKRVGTDAWITVDAESLVGVGDSIRTTTNGHARITFFANGTDTEVLPGSEFRIDAFSGSEAQYQLAVTVVVGQTTQRIAKLLDTGSSYTINSTGLELTVRGTTFAVRVEPNGRSSTIVQTGAVKTKSVGAAALKDPTHAENIVPTGYGVRAEAGKGLSDVVKAASFSQLDAVLDGCDAFIQTVGDVRLNVRIGPSLSFARIGYLDNKTQQHLIGITETEPWYRVVFKGGFGWVYAPALKLAACRGLRQYPSTTGAEDPTLYQGLDSDIDPNTLLVPIATPTAQASATP